jgi:hypothetical protein
MLTKREDPDPKTGYESINETGQEHEKADF